MEVSFHCFGDCGRYFFLLLFKEKRLIKGDIKVKILGQGEITVPLVVKVHKVSKTAQDKIEKAKGQVEIIS